MSAGTPVAPVVPVVPVVPSILRARRQWLCWKLVQAPGEPKPRKVPFYASGAPRNGEQGTQDDLTQLTDFASAAAACKARGYTGLGFALLAGSGLVALDFDHCVRDGQIMDSRIESLIADTYSEISPSGTGVRAFFTGELRSRKDNAHKSRRVAGEPGAMRLDGNFDVEVFGHNGFVTITGNHTAATTLWGLEDTVADLSPAVLALYVDRFGSRQGQYLPALPGAGDGAGCSASGGADLMALGTPKLGWSVDQAREYLFDCSASVSREEWLNALMAIHHEFDGSDEALDLVDEWSATGDSYAGRADVQARWRSFGRRPSVSPITGRWLLGWRRDHLASKADDRMREALANIQKVVEDAADMLVLQTQVLPQISNLLLEFPILEIEAYSVVASRAKRLGTPINKTEFKKLIRVERRPEPSDRGLPVLTEFGNTERLLRRHGDSLMFVPDLDSWFVWTGVYWRQALGGRTEVAHYAKEVVKDLANEAHLYTAVSEEFFAFCSISQRAQMVKNMVQLAESDPRVVVPSCELDKHPHFIGVKNGVVDLRTGVLLPPDPKLRITLITACEYHAAARAPLFEKTLREVLFDDADMVGYVMRACGYALTGDPREDIMFIAFGNGANGKSTIFNAVRETLGRYARSADATSFISDGKSGGAGGAREDLVRLRGARFVYVNEPEEGGELREAVVKSMTGGDTITARGLYATASVEITPTWTVFMPTNHKPVIKGSDNGIWRRMGMLPFERNFDNDPTIRKDGDRKQKLRGEMPGILAMLVREAGNYYREGLAPPTKVRAARDAYRNQMDLLAEWLDVHCVLAPGATSRMSDLWESWSAFAARNGSLAYIKSSTALGRRLDTRFPSLKGTGGVRERVGISLKTTDTLF